MRIPYPMAALFFAMAVAGAAATDESLHEVVAGGHRTPEFRARDGNRHPVETLEFFAIESGMKVAEIWPSGGWYAEILGPYLRDEGVYYAVGFSLTAKRTPGWRKNMARQLIERFESESDLYGNAIVTSLSVPEDTQIAPPASLDRVLTFRNVHNWIKGDYADGVFAAMYRALKPGGILGLVEHRANPGASVQQMKDSGYVSEEYVIELAGEAGFELIESSEINANPADSKDHPAGVWTLPPSLRLCRSMEDEDEKRSCQARYRAIGESDRMTLKFQKPGARP